MVDNEEARDEVSELAEGAKAAPPEPPAPGQLAAAWQSEIDGNARRIMSRLAAYGPGVVLEGAKDALEAGASPAVVREVLDEAPARDWLLRPYDQSSSDENAIYYLLGTTYAYSRAGWRAGASKFAMGRSPERAPTPDERAKEKAFFDAHRFIWRWLIANAEITLAVDPEAPHIIWGWLVTSGADVIHAIGCKRSAVEAGLSVDIVRDLLGGRLKRYQLCTLELPQMRAQPMGGQPRSDRIGLDRPTKWSLDPTWLLMRMQGAAA